MSVLRSSGSSVSCVQDQGSRPIANAPEDLPTLLNRIASLIAIGLTHERTQWAARGIGILLAVYNQGNELPSNHSAALTSPQVWLAVLDRAYGLGGLAVRLKEWPTIRLLAYQRGTDHGFSWHGSWLRHGLTNAARAGMLNSEGTHSSGLIAGAHNVVREVPALHPGTSADDDTVLNSLCQFDALGALVVMGETGITDSRNFYTNFARYYTQRTEPALVAITRDDAMREALFAGDAGLLRKSLRALVHIADKESFAYSGWEGISDPRLREALVD